MKVVVIGGTGLIGSQVVALLQEQGHEALAASPQSGVDVITGVGLAEAFAGADVVVDVTNSPVWEDQAVLDFFTTSTRNQLAAERAAGVGHHVALAIVGAERLPGSGYLRAKVAQEQLIVESGVPYSIVRATQFFEFVSWIADAATRDDGVHLAPIGFQPVAAADVARLVAETAVGAPLDGTVEIAGAEKVRMDTFVAKVLADRGDDRVVVADPSVGYFGGAAVADEIVPAPDADPVIGATSYADWEAGR
ncbi:MULTISPECIES: SDR family oxidoreductase [unclassified Nocardioides]|uniref:SDR family oxidoreductase n=1 Tax=unclassified Nocardioides TaxID=2615069 RepID=UPI003014D829